MQSCCIQTGTPVGGLCSHTCLSGTEHVIGGKVYFDQNVNTSVGTHFEGDPPIPVDIGSQPNFPIPGGLKRHESTCYGDDNIGAEAFLRVMAGLDLFPEPAIINDNYGIDYCAWWSKDPLYYNYTHSPCHWHPWSRVWASLCLDTCSNLTAPYPPVIPVVPTDESDDVGHHHRDFLKNRTSGPFSEPLFVASTILAKKASK